MREALANGAVLVWRVPVRDDCPTALLSDDEQDRANRLRQEDARHRFVSSRTALRTILGKLLEKEPGALAFDAGEHGKPFLASPASSLNFNAAHSGDKVLIAIADTLEVGVDIEVIEAGRDLEGIAHRYFRPEEYTALARLPDDERPQVFTQVWTRKEAYLKARGTGIRGGLASFSVSIPPQPPKLTGGTDGGTWSMADIACGEGYAATVCAAGGPLQVLIRDWEWGAQP